MNHVYRLIWSKKYDSWIPAAEILPASRKSGVTGTVLSLTAALLLLSSSLQANPSGGQVVAGQANIVTAPNTVTINQSSQRAAINWQDFSIQANETTRFNQPSSSSVTLNRITGQNPSAIHGSLQANGHVYLVNPNGIVFGQTARVDVNGLVATTHDITNEDFMAGNDRFTIPGRADAAVINQGNISIRDSGLAAFVAPAVRNDGVILATLGKVALAAGNGFTLDLYGDQLVELAVDPVNLKAMQPNGEPVDALVDNQGEIKAQTIALTARAARDVVDNVINNAGAVEATGILQQGGKIVLTADTGNIQVSGTLDASATGGDANGGEVIVRGESFTLTDTAVISANASGAGDGGFVDTSGEQFSIAGGAQVSASSPEGQAGTWLVDPTDVNVEADCTGITNCLLASTISSTLSGGTGYVVETVAGAGGGDINVNSAISHTGGATVTLTFNAHNDLNLNANIIADTADLSMVFNADSDNSGAGVVNLDRDITLDGNNGTIDASSETVVYDVSAGVTAIHSDFLVGDLDWFGTGVITGDGELNTFGDVVLSGTGIKYFRDKTWNNAGDLVLSTTGGGHLRLHNSDTSKRVVFNNLASATFTNLSTNQDPVYGIGGDVVFNNLGTVEWDAASTLSYDLDGVDYFYSRIRNVEFNNDNLVNVDAGLVLYDSPGTDTGEYVLNNTLLRQYNRYVRDSDGATFSGTGILGKGGVSFGTGQFNLLEGTTISPDIDLWVNNGTLYNELDLSVSKLTWESGTISGTGKLITPVGSVSNLTSNGTKVLDDMPWDNQGTINLEGRLELQDDYIEGDATTYGAPILTNLSDGVIDGINDGIINVGFALNGAGNPVVNSDPIWGDFNNTAVPYPPREGRPTIDNQSIINWGGNGGSTETKFSEDYTYSRLREVTFNNAGIVNVNTGLELHNTDGTDTGQYVIADDTILQQIYGTRISQGADFAGSGLLAIEDGQLTLEQGTTLSTDLDLGVSGGTLTSEIDLNVKSIEVVGGRLEEAETSSVAVTVDNLLVSAGTMIHSGDLAISSNELTVSGGTLVIPNDISLDLLTWSSGTISGVGRLITPIGSISNLDSNSTKYLDDKAWDNQGTINLKGRLELRDDYIVGDANTYGAPVLTNLSDGINVGIINVDPHLNGPSNPVVNNDPFWGDFNNPEVETDVPTTSRVGGPTLDNQGIINWNGNGNQSESWHAGTYSRIRSVRFHNSGTVNVNTGLEIYYSPGTDTGSYNIADNMLLQQTGASRYSDGGSFAGTGVLSVKDGLLELQAGSNLSSDLDLWITGGTLDAQVAIAPENLTITSGRLTGDVQVGTGLLTMEGGTFEAMSDLTLANLVWSGGTISGTGRLITPIGSISDLNSNATKYLDDKPWDNQGTINLQGRLELRDDYIDGDVMTYGAPILTNLSDGVIDGTDDGIINVGFAVNTSGVPIVNNDPFWGDFNNPSVETDVPTTSRVGRPTLENQGIINWGANGNQSETWYAGTYSRIRNTTFNNNGIVNVNTGLEFYSSEGIDTGDYVIADDVLLRQTYDERVSNGADFLGTGLLGVDAGLLKLETGTDVSTELELWVSGGTLESEVALDVPLLSVTGGSVISDQAITVDNLDVSGGSLTLSGDVTINSDELTVTGGTLMLPNDVTLMSLTWTAGTITGAGKLITPIGSVSNLASNTTKVLDDKAWDNQGTINLQGRLELQDDYIDGDVTTYGVPILTNLSDGTVDGVNDGIINVDPAINSQGNPVVNNDPFWGDFNNNTVERPGRPTINNQGIMNWNGNGNQSHGWYDGTYTRIRSIDFNNDGIVNVNSGLEFWYSGGTDTGSYVVADDLLLEQYGSERYLQGASVSGDALFTAGLGLLELQPGTSLAPELELRITNGTMDSKIALDRESMIIDGGVFQSTADLRVSNLSWNGGRIRGPGKLITDGTAVLSGNGNKFLEDKTWENTGTINLDSYTLYLYDYYDVDADTGLPVDPMQALPVALINKDGGVINVNNTNNLEPLYGYIYGTNPNAPFNVPPTVENEEGGIINWNATSTSSYSWQEWDPLANDYVDASYNYSRVREVEFNNHGTVNLLSSLELVGTEGTDTGTWNIPAGVVLMQNSSGKARASQGAEFTGDGIVGVNSGALSLNADSSFSSDLDLRVLGGQFATAVAITPEYVTVSGGELIGDVQPGSGLLTLQGGTFYANGDLTLSQFDWSGGTLAGTGMLYTTGITNLTGGGYKFLQDKVWENTNYSTINLAEGGLELLDTFSVSNTDTHIVPILVNAEYAEINVTSNAFDPLYGLVGYPEGGDVIGRPDTPPTLTNQGTMTWAGSPPQTYSFNGETYNYSRIYTLNFENEGVVNVDTALQMYVSPGTDSGEYVIADGAFFQVNGDVRDVQGGTFSGEGALSVLTGTLNLLADTQLSSDLDIWMEWGSAQLNSDVLLRPNTVIMISGTLTSALEVASGEIDVRGGTLDVSNDLILDNLLWSAGTIRGDGDITVTNNALVDGYVTLNNKTFINDGTFDLASGRLTLNEGAEVINAGIFNVDSEDLYPISGQDLYPGDGSKIGTVFRNTDIGTLNWNEANPSYDYSEFYNVDLFNDGLVNVNSDMLINLSDGTDTGVYNLNSNELIFSSTNQVLDGAQVIGDGEIDSRYGTLTINEGSTLDPSMTLTVTGPYSYDNNVINYADLVLDTVNINGGTLTNNNQISVDTFNWNAGILTGTGVFQTTGTSTVDGAGVPKQIYETTWENLGTVDLTEGYIYLIGAADPGDKAVFTNQGTVNVTTQTIYPFYGTNADNEELNNQGVFNWDPTYAGPDTPYVFGFDFNNDGLVNVNQPMLLYYADGTSKGTFDIDQDKVLTIAASTHNFDDGSMIIGDGVLVKDFAVLNLVGENEGLINPLGSTMDLNYYGFEGTGALTNRGIVTGGQGIGMGILINEGTALLGDIELAGLDNSGILSVEIDAADGQPGVVNVLGDELRLTDGVINLGTGGTLKKTEGTLVWEGGTITSTGPGGNVTLDQADIRFDGSGERVLDAPGVDFNFVDLVLPDGSLILKQGKLTFDLDQNDATVIPEGSVLELNGDDQFATLINEKDLDIFGTFNLVEGDFTTNGNLNIKGGSLNIGSDFGEWKGDGIVTTSGDSSLSGSTDPASPSQINSPYLVSGTLTLDGFVQFNDIFTNNGTINQSGGTTFEEAVTNNGLFNLDGNATFNSLFTNFGDFILNSGVATLNAGMNQVGSVARTQLVGGDIDGFVLLTDGLVDIQAGQQIDGDVTMNGGMLMGNGGDITGTLTVNGGILAPGASPGALNVGDLLLGGGAVTQIEIAGPTPATEYDIINVAGVADLNGTLEIVHWGGYDPAFDLDLDGVVTANQLTANTFGTVLQPNGFNYLMDYGTTVANRFDMALDIGVAPPPPPPPPGPGPDPDPDGLPLPGQVTDPVTPVTNTPPTPGSGSEPQGGSELFTVDPGTGGAPSVDQILNLPSTAAGSTGSTAGGSGNAPANNNTGAGTGSGTGTGPNTGANTGSGNVPSGNNSPGVPSNPGGVEILVDAFPPGPQPNPDAPLPQVETLGLTGAIEQIHNEGYQPADRAAFYQTLSEQRVVGDFRAEGNNELADFYARTANGEPTTEGELLAILNRMNQDAELHSSYLGVFTRMRHVAMSKLLEKAIEKLLEDPDLAEEFTDGEQGGPIAIKLKNDQLKAIDGMVKVEGVVESASKKLYLGINGQWVFVDQDGNFKAEVPVEQGDTELVLEAKDHGGTSAMLKVPVISAVAGQVDFEPGRRIALFIGVEEYDNAIPELETPVNDVTAVARELAEQQGFETRQINNPTKQQIIDEMLKLSTELKENDSLVVYYAGHGYQLEETGRGYWLPRDAGTADPENWLSNRDIARVFHRTPAKQILLVSDSCYSGAFTEAQRIDMAADDVRRLRAVMALSSGGEQPVWDGGADGHSIFASNMLSSIDERDIQGIDFYEEVRDKVVQVAPQVPGYGTMIIPGHDMGADFLLYGK